MSSTLSQIAVEQEEPTVISESLEQRDLKRLKEALNEIMWALGVPVERMETWPENHPLNKLLKKFCGDCNVFGTKLTTVIAAMNAHERTLEIRTLDDLVASGNPSDSSTRAFPEESQDVCAPCHCPKKHVGPCRPKCTKCEKQHLGGCFPACPICKRLHSGACRYKQSGQAPNEAPKVEALAGGAQVPPTRTVRKVHKQPVEALSDGPSGAIGTTGNDSGGTFPGQCQPAKKPVRRKVCPICKAARRDQETCRHKVCLNCAIPGHIETDCFFLKPGFKSSPPNGTPDAVTNDAVTNDAVTNDAVYDDAAK